MTDSLERKEAQLAEIAREIAACQLCPLHRLGRTRTVPGAGPANARIMFIGEAPGFNEDRQGLPFVGRSGQYLNYLLGTVGLSRKDVFIANVIKCRPPDNRDPEAAELAACKAYLDRQIEVIDPKVIITLGRFSMARYFPGARITRIHGQPRRQDGRIYFPMFHPAAALRNPNLRAEMEADMRKVMALIEELDSSDTPPEDDPPAGPPVQLSLF
ncbi:MAG: uracil-DNA glycosylase [Anaerolineae bacterium]